MNWAGAVVRGVAEWRMSLAIEGRATYGDCWRLVEAVGLRVEVDAGVKSHLWVSQREGFPSVIVLDGDLPDDEQRAAVLEEVGHYLYRHHPHYLHSRRGLLLSDGKNENPATAFRDLWLLAGVEGDTDEEVAAEAGCSVEQAAHYRSLLLKVA